MNLRRAAGITAGSLLCFKLQKISLIHENDSVRINYFCGSLTGENSSTFFHTFNFFVFSYMFLRDLPGAATPALKPVPDEVHLKFN